MVRQKIKQLRADLELAGRKYRLSLITILVIFAAYALSGYAPTFAPLYEEMVSGLIAVLFVYCGGNITNKWVLGKPKSVKAPPPEEG
jgi:hypothetical protein